MLKKIYCSWLTSRDGSSVHSLQWFWLGMCPPPRSTVKWCSSCEVNTAEFLRCWFEVLFIVAKASTKMCVRSRVTLTPGLRKSWRNCEESKGRGDSPSLRRAPRGSNIIHQGQLMKMSATPTKRPAKSYKLSWNFCDLKKTSRPSSRPSQKYLRSWPLLVGSTGNYAYDYRNSNSSKPQDFCSHFFWGSTMLDF